MIHDENLHFLEGFKAVGQKEFGVLFLLAFLIEV